MANWRIYILLQLNSAYTDSCWLERPGQLILRATSSTSHVVERKLCQTFTFCHIIACVACSRFQPPPSTTKVKPPLSRTCQSVQLWAECNESVAVKGKGNDRRTFRNTARSVKLKSKWINCCFVTILHPLNELLSSPWRSTSLIYLPSWKTYLIPSNPSSEPFIVRTGARA